MKPIASLRSISYRYPGAPASALDRVDLDVEAGLTLVAGSSGGGKSTLLRLLNGLVPQFHGGRISGVARVGDLDPLRTPIPRLAAEAGLVFQDVETQSVYGTVEREIAFGLENLGLTRAAMHERVDEALDTLSIEHLRGRRLATLSGGERQRVQLASVLAMRPRIVALDEPTSQLDREGSAAVLDACRTIAADGRAVLLAEHRLDDLLAATDRLLMVESGRIEGPGEPHRLAGDLASPPPLVELGREIGWRPLALTVEEAADRLRAAGGEHRNGKGPAVHIDSAIGGGPAWEVRDLTAAIGSDPIVEGFSFAAALGEVVAVVGANGSGKTTLLRTLAGLIPPLSGSIVTRPDRVAYVPQNPAALLHLPTLRAELELTVRRTGSGSDVADVLAAFGLTHLADRYPRDLSSGERQRGAIAATLAGAPDLALLDEPTRGMDLRSRRALGAHLRELSGRGAAIVIATHDVDLAAEVADRVVLLADHRGVDLGDPRSAFAAAGPMPTQIGRLFPGGPVSVPDATALLRGHEKAPR